MTLSNVDTIDNINKYFWSTNIRMISEGSCDTEDRRNDDDTFSVITPV